MCAATYQIDGNESLTKLPDAPVMTAHQIHFLPDSTYFFTVCLEDRAATTLVDEIDRLRAAYAITVAEMPVHYHAMVILPNHLHAIWTEPGTPRFSERWRRIKARFSQSVTGDFKPNATKLRAGERGLLQRRFWEHAIRTPDDFQKAMDYCRTNPVTHGLVATPEEWLYSSFTKACIAA